MPLLVVRRTGAALGIDHPWSLSLEYLRRMFCSTTRFTNLEAAQEQIHTSADNTPMSVVKVRNL